MIFIGATDEIGLDAGGKAVLGLATVGKAADQKRQTTWRIRQVRPRQRMAMLQSAGKKPADPRSMPRRMSHFWALSVISR